jgi:hypothetical protein
MEVMQRFEPALEEEVVGWKVMTYSRTIPRKPMWQFPWQNWTSANFERWISSPHGPGFHLFLTPEDAIKYAHPYKNLDFVFKVKARRISSVGYLAVWEHNMPTVTAQEIYIDTKSAIELDGVEEPEYAYEAIT